jgi:Lipoprotein LpqB beta-propeller domain/Sporulation and spore germination
VARVTSSWAGRVRRRAGRVRRGGGFPRRALVVLAVVLSAAGCVSMPNGGPPMPFDATQSGTGQNQDYSAPYAALPGAGWGPSDIVTGFLAASASYFNTQQVARAYLTPAADKTWNPKGSVTVFTNSAYVSSPTPVDLKHASSAMVTVSGQVQATLNTNGQVLSVAAQGQAQPSVHDDDACSTSAGSAVSACGFTLVKSAGQWRIARLPRNLLFNDSDFVRVYQSQDVYFFNPAYSRLVPDTVFVPLGTSVTTLLQTLVNTLITGPGPTWLNNATFSVLPKNTTVKGISLHGSTAFVDLGGGIVKAKRNQVAAQLAWTLVGPSGEQYNVEAVQLLINGIKVTGPQTPAMSAYQGYNPYPATQSTFSYADSTGAAQLRCGSLTDNTVAVAVPVFGQAAGPQIASCSSGGSPPSPGPTTSTKPGHSVPEHTANPFSMVAVSPGDKYVATVSAGKNQVSIWQVGGKGKAVASWSGTGVTSISWDQQPDLWITTPSGILVLPVTGKATRVLDLFGGLVSALSVAPDGVRVAAIVSGELELAAIVPEGDSSALPGTPTVDFSLGTPVPLGLNRITDAVALTWYDADDLMVIDRTEPGVRQLEEVPVNGRSASQQATSPVPPPGVYAESITADGPGNYLVVGLSNGQLEISNGLNGTWQPINASGSEPAYGGNS